MVENDVALLMITLRNGVVEGAEQPGQRAERVEVSGERVGIGGEFRQSRRLSGSQWRGLVEKKIWFRKFVGDLVVPIPN